MPTLPGLTVTQAQYDRIVAAFPGSTLAKKAVAYNEWLTNALIDYVRAAEIAAVNNEMNTLRAARLAAVEASLPPRPNTPVELPPGAP